MPDYTVSYIPTAGAPADSRMFTSGHPHSTLAEAKEEATNYLATYPERQQFAQIVKSEIVWNSPRPSDLIHDGNGIRARGGLIYFG